MQVRVTQLRRNGVRVEGSRSESRVVGHLVLSSAGGTSDLRKLTLQGPKHGAFDGPPIMAIYEPQLVRFGDVTMVVRGFERGEGRPGHRAGFVQEWMIEVRWNTGHIGPPLGETKPWVSTPNPGVV